MRHLSWAFLLLALPLSPALAQDGCDAISACVPEPGLEDVAEPFAPDAEVVFTPDLSVVRSAQEPLGGAGAGVGAGVGVGVAQAPLAGVAARPEETERIAARIAEAFAFCAAIQAREYVVDCVGERLEAIAGDLPRTGDYAPVRSVLDEASARLDTLVEQNLSPVLPLATARSVGPGGVTTSRPLRPVATETVDATIAAAADVVEEAQTVLLRAADDEDQARAFQTVSGALGQGTVLLRSV